MFDCLVIKSDGSADLRQIGQLAGKSSCDLPRGRTQGGPGRPPSKADFEEAPAYCSICARSAVKTPENNVPRSFTVLFGA